MATAKSGGLFSSLWKAGRFIWDPQGAPPLVNVVDLKGVISGADGIPDVQRRTLTVSQAENWLHLAFNLQPKPKAVAFVLDCPGGSPAATELLYKAIRRHADDTKIPVLAFAQSVAASGGYWAMCAADDLFALNTSLVGSMGVMLAGFGVQDAAKKLGIERRLYTAGTMKGFMDPFREVGPDEQGTIKELLEDLHGSFRDVVVQRRGGKLTAPAEQLFSGRIWTGRQALGLGLVDGIGDAATILRQRFGPEVIAFVVNPPPRTPYFARFLGMTAEGAGYYVAQSALRGVHEAVEENAHRIVMH